MPRDGAISRRIIHVRGIVQVVGFRPFVYNLAQGLGLQGYVLNSSAGVTIEVEGAGGQLDHFVSRLGAEAPPLAHIEDLDVTPLEPAGYDGFVIGDSRDKPRRLVPVSPDISTCDECMRDFRGSQDRASSGIGRVCLSGGTFQNMYLLERVVTGLRASGFSARPGSTE